MPSDRFDHLFKKHSRTSAIGRRQASIGDSARYDDRSNGMSQVSCERLKALKGPAYRHDLASRYAQKDSQAPWARSLKSPMLDDVVQLD